MGQPVPQDDLPSSVVPESDLPDSAAPLTWKDRLLQAGARGGVLFGVPGAVVSGLSELGSITKEAYDKQAYNAGGAVTDLAMGAGASPGVAAAAGYGTNVGIQAIPIAAGWAASKAAPALEKGGEWLMRSAAKPNVEARTTGLADRAIKTMLEKGISPTAGGLEATKLKVANLETSIQSILENSPATVGKTDVANAVKTAFDSVKLNLNKVQDTRDIQKALNDFLSHDALKTFGDRIPVSVANRMKQAFYKEVGGKVYLPGQAVSAYDKGEKALASGLRSEVVKEVPSVAPSLKEQSELLEVIKMIKPRVGAGQNQNLIGLGVLSPSMERVAVWMADRYPWFKSLMARALFSGSEAITAGAGGTLGVAAGDMAARRIQEQAALQELFEKKKKEYDAAREQPPRIPGMQGVRG